MSEDRESARAWTPAALRDLAMGFQPSRILLTAVELRLFGLIGDGGLTSAESPAAPPPTRARPIGC